MFQNVYGFGSVCAMIGNVVNSDAGLTMIYETLDAKGASVPVLSFHTLLRADPYDDL